MDLVTFTSTRPMHRAENSNDGILLLTDVFPAKIGTGHW